VLMLPGATLRTRLKATERMTASAVSGRRGAGHLMIGMIETLWRDNDTLEHFSRAFKERFRVTPKEFRRGLER
jgi:hypothetical protein